MFAERFGFTGTGGGGTGDSMERSVLWSSFKDLSSSFRTRFEDVQLIALDVGSIDMGRSVKVSRSSMMGEMVVMVCAGLELAATVWRWFLSDSGIQYFCGSWGLGSSDLKLRGCSLWLL